MQAARVRRTDGDADLKGKGQEEKKMSGDDGKIERVKYLKKKVETRGRGRLWLTAQVSSLDLGSVQESYAHTHMHTHALCKSCDGSANSCDSFDLRAI